MTARSPRIYVCVSGTVKAHLLRQGSLTAEDLAGRLHGDILRGFMCAEAVPQGQGASFGRAPAGSCASSEGARLTTLASAALLGERPAHAWLPAAASGARVTLAGFRRLQAAGSSRRFRRLWSFRWRPPRRCYSTRATAEPRKPAACGPRVEGMRWSRMTWCLSSGSEFIGAQSI